ncbi:hypothetical protein D1872_259820 [compost metagenome]
MIFDRPFALSGYDDNVLNPRGDRFFHNILNGRLIDDRQHFLGHGFGGGQKSRSHPGCGNNGFTDLHLSSSYTKSI